MGLLNLQWLFVLDSIAQEEVQQYYRNHQNRS